MEKHEFEKLNGEQWSQLLCEHPEYSDKCDWSKLESEDWCWLLSEHPEFSPYCNWEKLKIMNGVDFWQSSRNSLNIVNGKNWTDGTGRMGLERAFNCHASIFRQMRLGKTRRG